MEFHGEVCLTTEWLGDTLATHHTPPIMSSASPPVLSIKTITDAAHAAPAPYYVPDASILNVPLEKPYRTTYYGIGLCVAGSAVLMAGLRDHPIRAGSLITMSPTVIKQWKNRSPDYDSVSVFFQADFLLNNPADQPVLDNFALPSHDDGYVLALNNVDNQRVLEQLRLLQRLVNEPMPYRDETVRHLIWALLYQTAALHRADQPATHHSRKAFITREFRKLVSQYAARHYSVGYYADLLFITPKHLTETIRDTTGRTAGDWIAEARTLEARILLGNPALTIAQIADQLHFPDQSTFGKFFKKQTGLSPVGYRK
jgi:AraC family transcriptional regulator, transcriptional activator of pobA